MVTEVKIEEEFEQVLFLPVEKESVYHTTHNQRRKKRKEGRKKGREKERRRRDKEGEGYKNDLIIKDSEKSYVFGEKVINMEMVRFSSAKKVKKEVNQD